ncbi:GNAT family N-acetyltransferase [Streptomyces collinus]|uniref:GNAT family N-acetyltransferase n=1 Tax=Streptomyces collinus TaxID=42684 RepID=UPI0036C2FE2D
MSQPLGDDLVRRKLFGILYKTDSSVARLNDIIHWRAVTQALGLAHMSLNDDYAEVTPGYFYAAHSTAPALPQNTGQLPAVAGEKATWLLYPALRQEMHRKLFGDNLGLPWFIESEYRVLSGVDVDLKQQLGSKRFRGLLRGVRLSNDMYTLSVACGQQEIMGSEGAVDAFDRLHRMNLTKYGHKRNHFSREILEVLLASPLGPNCTLFLRAPRHGGAAVQAMLALRHGAELHLLVQGIDHYRVPSSHNLYSALMYLTYAWGVESGITTFNLGRGNESSKLNLGANVFYPLLNHLLPRYSTSGVLNSELYGLHLAAKERINASLTGLRDTVMRRKKSNLIAIPPSL